MNGYILPLFAATINGVTPYFLALFKKQTFRQNFSLLPDCYSWNVLGIFFIYVGQFNRRSVTQ